jgi:hypothetical protein
VPLTCPTGDNQSLDRTAVGPDGTFFTIYDVPGFVSPSTSATDWLVTVQLTGVTPPFTAPPDSPILINVTFVYTGPEVDTDGSTVTFAGFTIVSVDDGTSNGYFASQATKGVTPAGDGGASDQAVGQPLLPANPGTGTTPTPNLALWLWLRAARLALRHAGNFARKGIPPRRLNASPLGIFPLKSSIVAVSSTLQSLLPTAPAYYLRHLLWLIKLQYLQYGNVRR